MRSLAAVILVVLCAYGLIATTAGLYGAALSLLGGGLFAAGRLVFAASGLLALVIATGLADWLRLPPHNQAPPSKPETEGPEGMLR